jgi:hypothetical protein
VGLTEHIHFRISKYEKIQIETYKIDPPTIFRKALASKVRSFTSDPELILSAGAEGPAAVYINAWQRIMPAVTVILEEEDFLELKDSKDPLEEMRMKIALLINPNELQHLGIFMQGGDLSKKILMNCIEAHLEAHQ